MLITNPNQVKTETSQPQQPPSTDAQLLNQQLTTSQQPPQQQFVSQQQVITTQPQISTQQQSLMSPPQQLMSPQQFVNPQQVHNTSPQQVQHQQQQGLLSVTQPCTPLTVTAQLAQTPQGPRIILQVCLFIIVMNVSLIPGGGGYLSVYLCLSSSLFIYPRVFILKNI